MTIDVVSLVLGLAGGWAAAIVTLAALETWRSQGVGKAVCDDR